MRRSCHRRPPPSQRHGGPGARSRPSRSHG